MLVNFNKKFSFDYDIIVCGGGHAGCEASFSASKIGCKVLLITNNIDTIAHMHCNPSIGGQAKGNIVREIDSLGGLMASVADYSSLQHQILNLSKGSAVQSIRSQCDKNIYHQRIKYFILNSINITVLETTVNNLIIKNKTIIGVKTEIGNSIYAKSVILAIGTFLNPTIYIGKKEIRDKKSINSFSSTLKNKLLEIGFVFKRFKTGTPPRILESSINFKDCEKQEFIKNPKFFGFYETYSDFHKKILNKKSIPGWIPNTKKRFCWMTYTSDKTKNIIINNLKKSALYKKIVGTGPRYCPNIEEKYIRFKDKICHRIFLEPEGYFSNEWYINGLSTSFPFNIQKEILKTIKGLNKAEIIRPAYSIEYDIVIPNQLQKTLESKLISRLFFSGQINGTSGYEEAAAQGLVAGINAAANLKNMNPMILSRKDGYIGVLIDDLVNKKIVEPYRMFTSRSEYRLLFNSESSELRFIDYAKNYKLLDLNRISNIEKKNYLIKKWIKKFKKVEKIDKKFLNFKNLNNKNKNKYLDFWNKYNCLSTSVRDEIVYWLKYRGYIKKSLKNIKKIKKLMNLNIPINIKFDDIQGIKNEAKEKIKKYFLKKVGLVKLKEIKTIDGVKSSDFFIIINYILKYKKSLNKK
jgi:tRNA uridine 5-carboxymethylaminomethyl modification enzyme